MRIGLLLPLLAAAQMAGAAGDRDVLYQVSTIDALLAGLYDGTTAIEEVIPHGDFGIGTFDRLDGEMIVLDGTVYQAAYDGTVRAMPEGTLTPFMTVTHFDADQALEVPGPLSYDAFSEWLEAGLPSRNVVYAVRVEGRFADVRYRSVPRQEGKPYATLAEVTRQQRVFERSDIAGTLVGFWCPEFTKGINVPGFHLHFLSDDRRHAGHVLGFTLSQGTAMLDLTPGWQIALPETWDFLQADLAADRSGALHAVERGRAEAPKGQD